MNGGKKIRMLIADDHPVVRRGLAILIEGQVDMILVGEARNGKDAIALYLQHRPDILLLDLRMPEMDGVDAIKTIREQVPSARVIVLTTYDSEDYVYHAIQAGAQAYLLKDTPSEEIIATIRAVFDGETRFSQVVAARLATYVRESSLLTHRERGILHLLVEGKTNKEIEAALFISPSTTKTHISHILQKLNAKDRKQAVSVALRRGIDHLE